MPKAEDFVTATLPPASLGAMARSCVLAALLVDLVLGCGDGVGRPILRSSSGSGVAATAGVGESGASSLGTAGGAGIAAASVTGNGGSSSTASVTSNGGSSSTASVTGNGGAATTITLVASGGVTASSSLLGNGGQSSSCGTTESRADEAVSNEDNLASLINLVRELGFSCLATGTSDAVPSLSMSEALRCAARLHSQSGYAKGGAVQISRDTGIPESQIAEIEVTTDKTQNAEDVVVSLLVDERRCPPLADPQYKEIGVGFASDRDSEYWTILLTR